MTEVVKNFLLDGGITDVTVSDKVFTDRGVGEVKQLGSGRIFLHTSGDELVRVLPSKRAQIQPDSREQRNSGSDRRSLVVKYVKNQQGLAVGGTPRWKLARDGGRMAEDALGKLAQLMDRWGVSSEELMLEFGDKADRSAEGSAGWRGDRGLANGMMRGVKQSRAAAGKGIRWEHFMQVLGEMPVEIGGEQEIRSSLRESRAADRSMCHDLERQNILIPIIPAQVQCSQSFHVSRSRDNKVFGCTFHRFELHDHSEVLWTA